MLNQNDSWIFSKKEDLSLHLAVVILFLIYFFLNRILNQLDIHLDLNLIFITLFFDATHGMSSFILGFGKTKLGKRNLLFIPTTVAIVVWSSNKLDGFLLVYIYGILSTIHFMRQQLGFLMFTLSKRQLSRTELNINKFFFYFIMLGPVLLAAFTEDMGYRWIGLDYSFPIPRQMLGIFTVILGTVMACLVFWEIRELRKTNELNWSKWFHLIVTIFLWGIFPWSMKNYNGYFYGLMIIHHALCYLYFVHARMRSANTDNLLKNWLSSLYFPKYCSYLIGFTFILWWALSLGIESSKMTLFVMTYSVSHFVLDTYIWRKNYRKLAF